MGVLDNFEPKNLWTHFVEITKRMHDSGYEDEVRKYVLDVLKANPKVTVTYYEEGYPNPEKTKCDDLEYVGKRVIVARKKADEGYEDKPTIILQAHMDMVCVPDHNIFPLSLFTYQDADNKTWLKAGAPPQENGTTLGADDGIGVATALALIEDDRFKCGEIECFFTVQEETNMGGAAGFDPSILKGRAYLNLDSEDITTIYYGSAGGALSTLTKEIETEEFPEGYDCYFLEISGLQGGHSGVNINEDRANAICLMARFLCETVQNNAGDIDIRLVDFNGGTKNNAIPSKVNACVAVKENTPGVFTNLFESYIEGVKSDYKYVPVLTYSSHKSASSSNVAFTGESTLKVLNLLVSMPHGVLKMYTDPERKGVVESSTNLAIVKVTDTESKKLTINSSHRSSNKSSMTWIIAMHKSLAASNGADYNLSDQYPSWAPNNDSKLLSVAKDVYSIKVPEGYTANIIHAGLETAYAVQKVPEMDCISIGPTITNPHSGEESICVDTVPVFYDIVKTIITEYYTK